MSFEIEIVTTRFFEASLKRLSKKYRSFKDDLCNFRESLKANPMQGVEIAPNVRKIRMAISSKGKSKSGGARVITLNALVSEHDGKVYLLLIYDKSETSNVRMEAVKQIVDELGL